MAARRVDPWLTSAASQDHSLLASLEDSSVPQLEARLGALLSWPPSPRVAKAALEVLADSRFRAREQLGASSMAVGVALVHGATAAQFDALVPTRGLSKDILRWNELVLGAAAELRRKRSAAKKADTTPLPRKGLHEAWMELAKSRAPEAITSLLADFSNGPATQITERALALISFARDERIADAATALLAKPSVRTDVSVPLFAVLGMLLIAHGSRAHRETAVALTAAIPTLRWVELLLPDAPSTTTPKHPAKKSEPDSEASFLEWIAEAPEESSRRQLFADWLLERGSPRGEHAALQLAALTRELTPKERARVAALEKKHAAEWLRSLGKGVMKGWTRFHGAVLNGLRIHAWRPAEVPEPHDPQLATLTTFALDGSTHLPLDAFVRSARWPLLRELELPARLLRELPAAVATRLETLSITFDFNSAANLVETIASVELPAVRTLNLWGPVGRELLPALLELSVVQRCASLGLETSQQVACFEALRPLPKLQTLTLFQRAHLHTRDPGTAWRFSRAPGWKLAIELRPPSEYVDQFEADLSETLRQLDAPTRKALTVTFEDGRPVPPGLAERLARGE